MSARDASQGRVIPVSEHSEAQAFVVDRNGLPKEFPTHLHDPQFWEELGRTIATFGFLEDVLAKAIFSFTGTREYREDEIGAAYAKWVLTLERTISDQLSNLIDVYAKVVREHPRATITYLDDLIGALREATKVRNVLCHGWWQKPDHLGRSVPFFVNRQKEVFETAIGIEFLRQLRQHAVDLICEVIDTVTHMGWQFPGSIGPGRPIWP
jgi:hypothetical protein